MNKLVFFFILAIGLNSCSLNQKLNKEEFYAFHWNLQKIDALNDEENTAFDQAYIRFSASDSVFSGLNGCNRIHGKYLLDGNTINFGEILSTKRYCGEVDEQQFHKVLEQASKIEIKDDKLFLYEDKLLLAVFAKGFSNK